LNELVNLGKLFLLYKRKFKWDVKHLKVNNNEQANFGVTREHREGWDPKQFA